MLACMAAWVWLCSFPAPAYRMTHFLDQQADGCQGKTKRPRFANSVATMLAEREAVPPELMNMDSWRARHNPTGKFTAQALLRAEPSHTWDGPLTPWSDEAALQRCFLGYPLGAYVVKVTHVFHLPDPRPLFTRINSKGEEVALTLREGLVFLPGALTMESLVFQQGKQGGCAPAASGLPNFKRDWAVILLGFCWQNHMHKTCCTDKLAT